MMTCEWQGGIILLVKNKISQSETGIRLEKKRKIVFIEEPKLVF